MLKEQEIIKYLTDWLKDKFFEKSISLIAHEVKFVIADFNFRADLIAIQSKSNVIHGFEIKSKLKKENVLSAIWQTNSYYTNYKWLVILSNDKKLFSPSILSEKLQDIGLIVYDIEINKFSILKQAQYIDGNFLKFLPNLEEQWITNNKSSK